MTILGRGALKPLTTSNTPLPRPTGLLVFSSAQTILPGHKDPRPVTIVVHRETGKILDVVEGDLVGREELDVGKYGQGEVTEWVDVPEGKVLLPGLVE